MASVRRPLPEAGQLGTLDLRKAWLRQWLAVVDTSLIEKSDADDSHRTWCGEEKEAENSQADDSGRLKQIANEHHPLLRRAIR
jgi:hypothetical protein